MGFYLLPLKPTELLKFKKDHGLYKQYIEIPSRKRGKKKKTPRESPPPTLKEIKEPFLKVIPTVLNSLPKALYKIQLMVSLLY